MADRKRSDRSSGARDDGRNESEAERLDRNWNELLQELRVTQTGTQILTGFLLTLAFQPKFQDLDAFQVTVYLALIALAALSTALGLGPVSLHRALFRQGAKKEIVTVADRLVQAILLCVGLVITGVVLLIFDVVLGRTAGVVAGVVTAIIVVSVWLVLPAAQRIRDS
ncbi:MAG: sodium:proton antiporter [Naasia sp.]|jgi:hypothetical protein|uniref:DUF6328 family protein n=1 Tax=Naasia sp. TaxID=2546198 RepID=UPI00262A5F40|nr:DUF6328 family protein [Naasia sp.]MCU1571340.1 sodium:proton antiporter [Naasia sp.]